MVLPPIFPVAVMHTQTWEYKGRPQTRCLELSFFQNSDLQSQQLLAVPNPFPFQGLSVNQWGKDTDGCLPPIDCITKFSGFCQDKSDAVSSVQVTCFNIVLKNVFKPKTKPKLTLLKIWYAYIPNAHKMHIQHFRRLLWVGGTLDFNPCETLPNQKGN